VLAFKKNGTEPAKKARNLRFVRRYLSANLIVGVGYTEVRITFWDIFMFAQFLLVGNNVCGQKIMIIWF
jgi:hypothetical protein